MRIETLPDVARRAAYVKTRIPAALVFLVVAGPTSAQAVTLHVNANGILTGASNVDVGGTFYDVQFVDGSCVTLFVGCDNATADFAFTSEEAASVAAQSLLEQVLTDTTSGQFDSHPELTEGCGPTGFCSARIPYAIDGPFVESVDALNFLVESGDGLFVGPKLPTSDTDQNPVATFAVWLLASVPEPGTLALLGLGLLGLGVVRRRAAWFPFDLAIMS